MARARTIKHGFFTNDQLAELPMATRLLFAGLWTIADREGRLLDRPKKIKAEVMPYDDLDADCALQQLADAGFIIRHQVDGVALIQVAKWRAHQNPHPNEAPSELPGPPSADDSREHHERLASEQRSSNGTLTEDSGRSPVSGTLTIPSGSSGPRVTPSPARAPARDADFFDASGDSPVETRPRVVAPPRPTTCGVCKAALPKKSRWVSPGLCSDCWVRWQQLAIDRGLDSTKLDDGEIVVLATEALQSANGARAGPAPPGQHDDLPSNVPAAGGAD